MSDQGHRQARMLGELVTSDDEWASRFLRIAAEVATWSKDPMHQVGCVVVQDRGRQVAWGYNGFPRGIADLKQRLRGDEKNDLVIHAERNALDNAGFDVRGATMYVTRFPCLGCALSAINRGISVLVAPPPERGSTWFELQQKAAAYMAEAGLQVLQVTAVQGAQ